MAGVSAAWLLDGAADVLLYESAPVIGGNVRVAEVEVADQPVRIDFGAQDWNPGPYPVYARLLEHLGLHVPDDPAASDSHESPMSITVFGSGEDVPRFVSPSATRTWPMGASWNGLGMQTFLKLYAHAPKLEADDADWLLPLEDWLVSIGLSTEARERVALPWMAALYSGEIDHARAYSARASMTFLSLALGPGQAAVPSYFTLKSTMLRPLERLLATCTTCALHTSTALASVSRDALGGGWWCAPRDGPGSRSTPYSWPPA
jgi:predicted NAD/FAD-binding protein